MSKPIKIELLACANSPRLRLWKRGRRNLDDIRLFLKTCEGFLVVGPSGKLIEMLCDDDRVSIGKEIAFEPCNVLMTVYGN